MAPDDCDERFVCRNWCRISGDASDGRLVLRPYGVVVLAPQPGGVADPGVDRLLGDASPLEVVGAAAPHVYEELRPRRDASLLHQSFGVRAKLADDPNPGQHVDGALLPLGVSPFQMGPQLRRDRHRAMATAGMMLDLRLVDNESAISQSTSDHLSSLNSLGNRMPAYRGMAKVSRQSLSGQTAITRSISSADT